MNQTGEVKKCWKKALLSRKYDMGLAQILSCLWLPITCTFLSSHFLVCTSAINVFWNKARWNDHNLVTTLLRADVVIFQRFLKIFLWNVDITCGGLSENHFITLGLWQNFNNYPPRYRRQPDRTSPWWYLRNRLRYPHIGRAHGRWNRARKQEPELYIHSRKLSLC